MKKYEQVRAKILSRIQERVYRPGAKIPSIRELSQKLNVSTLNISRAIEELVKEGLLWTEAGKGCFVVGLAEPQPADEGGNAIGTVGVLLQLPINSNGQDVSRMYSDTLVSLQQVLVRERLNMLSLRALVGSHLDNPFIDPAALAARRLSGLVSVGIYSLNYLAKLKGIDVPLVALDIDSSGIRVDCAVFDQSGSAARMVRWLHGQGAREIAFLGGPFLPPRMGSEVYFDPCAYERFEGWRAAMLACGLQPREGLVGEVSHRAGSNVKACLGTLLENGRRPDAILAEDPATVAQALEELGVPAGTVKLAGWGPPAQPDTLRRGVEIQACCSFAELGRAGIRLLQARMREVTAPVERVVITPEIVTARPPQTLPGEKE